MKEATSTKKMTLHLNGHTCQCTCEIYLKEYQCEHLLALGILYGVYNCPVEAKNVPLGQKRKPGRPAKAKKSLVRQEWSNHIIEQKFVQRMHNLVKKSRGDNLYKKPVEDA